MEGLQTFIWRKFYKPEEMIFPNSVGTIHKQKYNGYYTDPSFIMVILSKLFFLKMVSRERSCYKLFIKPYDIK